MSDEFDNIETEEETSDSSPEPKQAKPAAKAGGKAVVKKKPRRKVNRVSRWFREMKSELKKVSWPSPKQVTNNTVVALSVMVVSAVVIWGVDQVASIIFNGIRTALSFR